MAEFKITSRWTGATRFVTQFDESDPESDRMRLAIERAVRLGANLNDAGCGNEELVGLQAVGGRLPGASFVGADLTGAKLERSDLRGADFESADLTNACLDRCDLTGANFSGATLAGATFEGAKLPAGFP